MQKHPELTLRRLSNFASDHELRGLYHHLYSQQFESTELSRDFLKNGD